MTAEKRIAQQHDQLLAKLEPLAVLRHQIGLADLAGIDHYLQKLQGYDQLHLTWDEIAKYPSAYTTSLIVHELMELRFLAGKGIIINDQSSTELREILAVNLDVHLHAVCEEHRYLQDYISRTYRQHFEVVTLLGANRCDSADLDLLLTGEVGLFRFEPDRVTAARQILKRMKMTELKYRKLQHLNDQDEWIDDAFAYEDETGKTVFCYSVLTWGRVGSTLNGRIQKAEISLEAIETVVQTSQRQRWLPIRTHSGGIEAAKAILARECNLPQPKRGERVIITGTSKTS